MPPARRAIHDLPTHPLRPSCTCKRIFLLSRQCPTAGAGSTTAHCKHLRCGCRHRRHLGPAAGALPAWPPTSGEGSILQSFSALWNPQRVHTQAPGPAKPTLQSEQTLAYVVELPYGTLSAPWSQHRVYVRSLQSKHTVECYSDPCVKKSVGPRRPHLVCCHIPSANPWRPMSKTQSIVGVALDSASFLFPLNTGTFRCRPRIQPRFAWRTRYTRSSKPGNLNVAFSDLPNTAPCYFANPRSSLSPKHAISSSSWKPCHHTASRSSQKILVTTSVMVETQLRNK